MSSKLYNYAVKFLDPIKSPLLTLVLLSNLLISPALSNVITGNSASKEEAINVARSEVWGYDLEDCQLIPPGYGLVGLPYRAPNGDLVFETSRCIANCDQPGQEKFEYGMLWFFAGTIEFTKDLTAYSREHRLESYYPGDRAELLNGECIRTVYLPTGRLCQVNPLAENILIKGQCAIIDKAKNRYDIAANINPEIKRYSIIGAQSNIYRYIAQEDGLCDRGGPGGGELIYQQLYPMEYVIGLKDGTFIALRGDLIIRFDGNFKTKFTAKHNVELAYKNIIKGNFFVLPYEKIEELMDKVATNNDHGVQGLHDELLLYLYRRPENK